MHRTGIQSTSWIEATCCEPSDMAYTDIDIICKDPKPIIDRDDVAPFVIASFDIETFSSTGKFPDANIPGDECFQIAITLKKPNGDIYDRTCLCYPTTTPRDDCTVCSYKSEKDLLIAFKDYIHKWDPDVLTGWNIFGFDLEYLWYRSICTQCNSFFNELGKLKDVESELVTKKLSSSALGDNLLNIVRMPGRYVFDLFQEIKREHKFESYSLNFVSNEVLGDKKIDMTPNEMFRRFKLKDPDLLSEVAEYCVKDTELPHRIMDKLCTFLNMIEMAKATWVPIDYLSERGQQIKVFSQIAKKARDLGFMIPTMKYQHISSTYEGATVLEAHTGAYYVPITALDFEGLYPSIMIAHNLCYSTIVLDYKYANIPGVKYDEFKIGDKVVRFAQNVPSLLPEILTELKTFRKQAKKDMAKATGSMKQVYNGKQLAYKVSMNSVYGFTGACKGILPCMEIAATVTAEGRNMIEQTKELVEREFPGAKVRYGDTDSVMVEFDTKVKVGEEEDAIRESWKLGEMAAEMCNKMFRHPKNLELEKVYWPYILYSKKRYAAKLWTVEGKDNEPKMNYIDVKGLQLVRRDNTAYVREVSRDVLDIILESNDPSPAIELCRQRAKELLSGKVPMEKLVLSQKLADHYKNTNLAHVRVRDLMREREPGSEPKSGDRVRYVLCHTDKKAATMGDRAEDPVWVEKHGLALDYMYYFSNKFMKPLADLMEPLVSTDEIFKDLYKPKKKRKQKQKPEDDLEGNRRLDEIWSNRANER